MDDRTRGIRFLPVFCIILLAVLLFMGTAPGASGKGELQYTVMSTEFGRGFAGAQVLLDGGNVSLVRTLDGTGTSVFNVAPGNYTVTVIFDEKVILKDPGIMVENNVLTSVRKDVVTTTDTPVLLTGVVRSNRNPVRGGLIVNITSLDTPYWNQTEIDDDGEYSIWIPGGMSNLSILKDGELKSYDSIGPYADGKREKDLDVDLGDEEDFNITGVVDFIIVNAFFIALLIVALVLLLAGYGLLSSWMKKIEGKQYKYLNKDVMKLVRFTSKAVYAIIAVTIGLNLAGHIGSVSENELFGSAISVTNSALLILLIILIARILLIVVRDTINHLRTSGNKLFKDLPPAMFMITQLLLRYLVIFTCGLLVLLVGLSAVGLYDEIARGSSDFFSTNANYISFIVVLFLLAYGSRKFISLFSRDMKKRVKRFSPEMIETGGRMMTALIYFIIGLLVIFTLLSMAGMAEIGQTILLLMVTLVGVVVAMVATGSIGNILSGLMLQSMKPFDVGDRVKVGNGITGDVENMNLVFTRIRTLDHEIVDVPNNLVLGTEIMNFTASKTIAVDVTIGVGYEVPGPIVEKLSEDAAKMTEGVLKIPSPNLLTEELGDYAITYRLRAYTDQVKALPSFKSRLLRNIHNEFYESGVEIMSPMFMVRRAEEKPVREDTQSNFQDFKGILAEQEEAKGAEAVSAAMNMFDMEQSEKKTE